MSKAICTMCSKDVVIGVDNIIHGYCDDGADIYAHEKCVIKGNDDITELHYHAVMSRFSLVYN